MPIRLSKAFVSTPETTLRMQLAYDLVQARKDESKIKAVSPCCRNSAHSDIRRRNAESNGVGGSAGQASPIDQGKLTALTRVVLPR